jgi:hypothetical protein
MSTITQLHAEPSALRSSASRVNGSKSRGPVTEQGKLASSHNSHKHGLYSEALLLVSEDSHEFLNLREALENSIQPEDEYERLLVGRLANAHVRLNRVLKIEADMMNLNLEQRKPGHSLFYNAQSTLNLILRYIASAERTIDKATRELANHRKAKATNSKNKETNPRQEMRLNETQANMQKEVQIAKNEETNPSPQSKDEENLIPGLPTLEEIANGKIKEIQVDLHDLDAEGWKLVETAYPNPDFWVKARAEAAKGPKTVTLKF